MSIYDINKKTTFIERLELKKSLFAIFDN